MQGLVFGFLYKFIGEIDARMSASVILADLIHFGCYFWVFLKNPGLAVFSGLRAPANISWQQKRYTFYEIYQSLGSIIVNGVNWSDGSEWSIVTIVMSVLRIWITTAHGRLSVWGRIICTGFMGLYSPLYSYCFM